MHKKHQFWLHKYLENCRLHNLSEHTLRNYKCDLEHYLLWIERRFRLYLPRVKSAHISEYKKHMAGEDYFFPFTAKQKMKLVFRKMLKVLWIKKEHPKLALRKIAGKTYSITTTKRHLSAVSNFHAYLKDYYADKKGLFDKNPVRQKLHGVRLKEEDMSGTKLLTKEDWKKLTEYTWRPREKVILYLLYYGGFRLSELVSLRFEDFNFDAGIVRVRRKGGSIQKLALRERKKINEVISRYSAQCKPDQQFLFPGRGSRLHLSSKAMYDYLIKLFNNADCPTIGLGPHSFRKACATNLYKKTKDLLLVRDYLNHKDAKVTQTYIDRI